MKLNKIDQVTESILGRSTEYKLQIIISIKSIDDEGENKQVVIKVLDDKSDKLFDKVKELLIENIDDIIQFMLVDEPFTTKKQEEIIENQLSNSLVTIDVNYKQKGLTSKRIEFWHETLFKKEDFNFISKNYIIIYRIIITPVGKTIGGKGFGLSHYWSLFNIFRYLLPKKEQKLLGEGSKIKNPKEWIILPANTHGDYCYPDLLVSTKIFYKGKDWDACQNLLHKNKQFMLTIRQFVDFLKLLKSSNLDYSNGQKISEEEEARLLNEIRSEWIDAEFMDREGELYITYHKINSKGDIAKVEEPLQICLMDDRKIDLSSWLENTTKQGLPLKEVKNGSLNYEHPEANSVVSFHNNPSYVLLNCNDYPFSKSNSEQGVRRVKFLNIRG